MKKTKVEKMFGSYLCSDDVLKRYMKRKDFSRYITLKEKGEELDAVTAKSIAKAIKTWAIDNEATHYSHWFAPLNGKTAEKQVSFIEVGRNGKYIEDFNEKSLIKGETDASSFPNGGERMTFEARGYTVWDYTSPVFIKEDNSKNKVVYIPTAFCSYNGTALDEKTPLLRAIESLNKHSLRILKHLGYDKVKRVICNVGAEQEYFLIKTEDYEKRLDLKMTGRTLLGDNLLKTQDVCSHYFGMIDDNISAFMNEVDRELWKMGISAKLQHNEVAPCQHELVPIFSSVNTSSDQNQIIMNVITNIAKKHGYSALFHEKPFANMNGSGKHINWSISTDTGMRLLDSNLEDKNVFLVFFSSMITAIDRYYKLIRSSTAYRGNDLRLGGDEAPPTIISVFIGEKLSQWLTETEDKTNENEIKKYLDTRVKTLPKTVKDYCDRNRTSPFAYGGNKFEFRMVGSSQSIAWPSTCICTILAKVLSEIADELDKTTENKTTALLKLLKENITNHKRIIFNGNGYDNEWREEAKKRGLVEYRDSLESYKILDDKDILELFESMEVLDSNELSLRKSTLIKNYVEDVKIEAKTLVEMLNKNIYPCLNKYINELSLMIKNYKLKNKNDLRKDALNLIDKALSSIYVEDKKLNKYIEEIKKEKDLKKSIIIARNKIVKSLENIRKVYDDIEKLLPDEFSPFPSYNNILFK